MKKIVLSLYVFGLVLIIKSVFRAGIVDGALTILLGVLLIFIAYNIGKSSS